MKIGLRGGHSPNCKGAFGIVDEQAEVRKIYNETAAILRAAGHTVIDCNSNAGNVNAELNEGTNKANVNGCDVFFSIHMNSSYSAQANGFEIWLYDNRNSNMNSIASRMCSNFKAKGFENRGTKYNTGYHDLNATNMPAAIIETLFCSSNKDVDLYRKLGTKGVASLIASAIIGKTVTATTTASKPTNNPVNNAGVKYTAHVQNNGWQSQMRDGQTAGTTNQSKRLEALKIDTCAIKDMKLTVKVHIQDIGWTIYKDINKDTIIGTVGKAKRIEAIEIDATGIPTSKRLMYEVYIQDYGWTGWVKSGYTAGTVGIGKRIEAIRIKLV